MLSSNQMTEICTQHIIEPVKSWVQKASNLEAYHPVDPFVPTPSVKKDSTVLESAIAGPPLIEIIAQIVDFTYVVKDGYKKDSFFTKIVEYPNDHNLSQ